MMNCLKIFKGSTNVFFHYVSMFKHWLAVESSCLVTIMIQPMLETRVVRPDIASSPTWQTAKYIFTVMSIPMFMKNLFAIMAFTIVRSFLCFCPTFNTTKIYIFSYCKKKFSTSGTVARKDSYSSVPFFILPITILYGSFNSHRYRIA